MDIDANIELIWNKGIFSKYKILYLEFFIFIIDDSIFFINIK